MRLLPFILLSFLTCHAHSLDISKACDELTQQKEALLSKFSTSLSEANMAGQCIGYQAITSGTQLNLEKACSELVEQKSNLLGSLSTSFEEANQAGICMGAIYAACGSVNSYNKAAESIINKGLINTRVYTIKKAVGCYG